MWQVLYQLYGTEFCAKKLEDAGIGGKALADYYTWMLERTLELMQHEGQWVIVVDLNGWNLGHLNMRHLRYVRAFVDRISVGIVCMGCSIYVNTGAKVARLGDSGGVCCKWLF
jgi:hypothetical protein